MNTNNYQPPDLASVLRTLSQYAPVAPSTTSATAFQPSEPLAAYPNISANKAGQEDQDDDYEPPEDSTFLPAQQAIDSNQWSSTTNSNASQSFHENGHSHSISRTSTPLHNVPGPTPPPTVDPTTITDWSTALKCVMKTVGRSDAIQMRIRKMIQVQHDHEKQWFEGRKALLEKQNARAEGKKKLDSVLLSVGGIVPTSSNVSTPEDDAAEITRYDIKVHRAATEMVKAMSTELQHLGIPFFGTKSHLVSSSRDTIEDYESPLQALPSGTGTSSALPPQRGLGQSLTSAELTRLQRRMLELLEDLCKA